MRSLKSNALFLLVSLLFIVGCSEKEVGIDHDVEAQFTYSVDAVFEQKVHPRDAEPLKGVMTIHSHETDSDQILVWYVVLDEDLKTLTSSMKSVLPYGVYDFQLVIENGEKRYLAESKNVTVDGESSVPLAIAPVIGDVAASVDLTELPKLKFSFPLDELQTVGDPKLGVSIDGGAETIMSLSKVTVGTMPIDIDAGAHTIVLNFYDGAILVGKSVAVQESVTIVSGYDIVMDIVPLSAKASISSTIDGGELSFSVTIPHEIVDEVGGLENLTSFLRVMSAKNSFYSDPLTVTPNGDDYVGTITFPEFYYDDNVDLSLQFMKKTGGVVADGSLFGVSITSELKTLTFPVKLLRESISSGNLLARGIVNVYSADNTPAAGAIVSLSDDALGLTGSDGSLEFFATAGNYTLRAEKSGAEASEVVDLTPLGSHNYTLTLGNTPSVIPELIWMSGTDNNYEIMHWNGTETIALTDNNENEQWLDVDDSKLIWTVDSKIYYWDGENTTVVTSNTTGNFRPYISKGYVVWPQMVNGVSEIFLWNGSTVQQLTNDGLHNRTPHNNGERVAWVSTIDGKDVVRYWDGTSIRVISSSFRNEFPRVGETMVTWYGFPSEEDTEIHSFVWKNGVETQITDEYNNGSTSAVLRKDIIDGDAFLWTCFNSTTSRKSLHLYNGESVEKVCDDMFLAFDVSGTNVIWTTPKIHFWDGSVDRLIDNAMTATSDIDLEGEFAVWCGHPQNNETNVYLWNGEEIIQITNTPGVDKMNPLILK